MPAEAYGIKRVVVTTLDSDVPLLQKNFYIAQKHGPVTTPGQGLGQGVGTLSSPSTKSSPQSPGMNHRGLNMDSTIPSTNSQKSQKSMTEGQNETKSIVSSPPSTILDFGPNSIRLSKPKAKGEDGLVNRRVNEYEELIMIYR